jgi:hypothetical protein
MKTVLSSVLLSFLLLAACHNPEGSQNNTASKDTSDLSAVNAQTDVSEASHRGSSSDQIIPGRYIGPIFLGESPDSVLDALGKPDFSDAAMGKAWLTWRGKRDEHNNQTQLDVYVTYKDSSMSTRSVQQIRTTSSNYQLADSLHVYSSFQSLQGTYPDLAYTGSYQEDGREIKIYDAEAAGVAFEIVEAGTQRICTGIIIHLPGTAVNNVYFSHSAGQRP